MMGNILISCKRKIRDNKAFTLAEALVAVIILLLVSAIVAAGIPSAMRAYDNVVLASNSEMLMSTAMSALRNELGTAKNIEIPGATPGEDGTATGESINYYNEAAGSISQISKQTSGNISDIVYQRYYSNDLIFDPDTITDSDVKKKYQYKEKLVSDEASDKNKELHITYESVSYNKNKGVVTFNDLRVLRKDGTRSNTFRDQYKIRVITD